MVQETDTVNKNQAPLGETGLHLVIRRLKKERLQKLVKIKKEGEKEEVLFKNYFFKKEVTRY